MSVVVQLNFECLLCGWDKYFTMPVGKKTKSGDTIRTLEEYHLVCKNCLKSYILDYKITAI